MHKDIVAFLQCPTCKKPLVATASAESIGNIIEGRLTCAGGHTFAIRKGIPRFVQEDSYAQSFSFEWQLHRSTQLDSASGYTISEQHFLQRLPFPADALKGKLALDVGCGAGRFTEVALRYGARVIAIDLSLSVEVAAENLARFEKADIIQADILNLPFRDGVFDFAWSFGVLHHTPQPKEAFLKIARLLTQGGAFSIFVYAAYNKAIVYTSAFWRFFTTRMPKRLLYACSFIAVPLYYLYRIPVVGSIGKMIFVIPMWQDWRWRVLDTFDWYSPRYQSKHTHWEVYGWFREGGFHDIAVHPEEVTMSGIKQ